MEVVRLIKMWDYDVIIWCISYSDVWKQVDELLLFLFHFTSECSIQEIQETEEGMILEGGQQFLVYADDDNLLGDKINVIKKMT